MCNLNNLKISKFADFKNVLTFKISNSSRFESELEACSNCMAVRLLLILLNIGTRFLCCHGTPERHTVYKRRKIVAQVEVK